jgi:arabinose-5-phosphate isomerase
MHQTGENVVRIEAQALNDLADRIAGPMAEAFNRAAELLYFCSGRVVVTGMGKSGLIARKIAATLSSTGTPSLFMHPVEALHGDLGMLTQGDVVIALSASGETEEILQLMATIKRLRIPLVAITCDENAPQAPSVARTRPERESKGPSPANSISKAKSSTLADAADVALSCAVAQEACTLGLAPTASTTAMLALGDALAVSLAERKGFKEEDFASLHPGGKLGKRLARVEALMHTGDAVPRVPPNTRMPDVIYEMSRKKLGVTAVVEGDKLVGIVSDGDLRRLLEHRGKDALDLTAGECMTVEPKTISAHEFAATALAMMEEKKITSLAVIDANRKLEGIVHLHDLWGTQML